MIRGIKIIGVLLTLFVLPACYYLQSSGAPIETVLYPAPDPTASRAEDLVVMLPGIGDYPEAFERNQFIQQLQARLPLDAMTVNAHLGYYNERNLLVRLKEDVIEPARARGYKRIHFVGVSLGGYGTLLYMRQYPQDVSSAILLAPYLGQPDHYQHLLGGGEIRAQQEENIWPWIESLPAETLSRIYLGFGKSDTYAESHRLLSRFLPADHSLAIAGAHRWSTWQQLWPGLLRQAQRRNGKEVEALAER